MGAITKTVLALAFATFLNLTVTKLLNFILAKATPALPPNIACLAVKSGIIDALNILISILIYGFMVKQIIAYFRSVN